MPSIGRLVGEARAQRDVVAACAQPGHRGARGADAGQDGEVGAGDVVDELGAEPLEGDLDRAHVAGSVVADRDLHSRPFVDGSPAPSGADSRAQRAADRLERGLGDVVRVAAGRLDVDRSARGLREAREHVRGHPGLELELQLGAGRPPRSTAARASASSIGTTASP